MFFFVVQIINNVAVATRTNSQRCDAMYIFDFLIYQYKLWIPSESDTTHGYTRLPEVTDLARQVKGADRAWHGMAWKRVPCTHSTPIHSYIQYTYIAYSAHTLQLSHHCFSRPVKSSANRIISFHSNPWSSHMFDSSFFFQGRIIVLKTCSILSHEFCANIKDYTNAVRSGEKLPPHINKPEIRKSIHIWRVPKRVISMQNYMHFSPNTDEGDVEYKESNHTM